MVAYESERQRQSQQRTSHRYFLPSFGTFGQTVSEENNCLNQPIRNKSRLWQGELKKSFEQHSLKVFELSCE